MDATIIASFITLLTVLITLVTGITGFTKLFRELRTDRAKQKQDESKQSADNIVSSVDAAGKVTASALQINDALRNELGDCYEKLEDQAELRLRESQMRMEIGEIADKIAQMLCDNSIESPRCLIHRSILVDVQMRLQALAKPSAPTQPLKVRRKDE